MRLIGYGGTTRTEWFLLEVGQMDDLAVKVGSFARPQAIKLKICEDRTVTRVILLLKIICFCKANFQEHHIFKLL